MILPFFHTFSGLLAIVELFSTGYKGYAFTLRMDGRNNVTLHSCYGSLFLLVSLAMGLCRNHLAGAGLHNLALSSGSLDGGTCALCEGMGLNGNVLAGELVASDDDLVGVVLGLGDGLGFEERFEIAGRSGGDVVQRIQLDKVVDLLGVSGSGGSSGELGQPAV